MPSKDPDHYKKWRRNYYQNNKEKFQKHSSKWHQNNTEKKRAYNIFNKYGITIEDYNRMLEEQEHCCKICLRPAQLEKRGILFIDHLKGTKVVRGLLCVKCNTAIGLFDERISVLSAAIEYLRCQPLTP